MTPRVPFAERGGQVRGLLDLATGCYPAFLFGGATSGLLPVFHLHEVTSSSLEPKLAHLAENGYRTVRCDDIARWALEGVHPGPRTVALTFDDAWSSVWTVAGPLLKRYGLTGILFVIPARVEEADGVRPTIDEAPGEEASGSPFATWPEIRQLHGSGLFDVQSHTRSHAMIFADDRVAGFVTPGFSGEPLLERPLAAANGEFLDPQALGAPLYLRRSRMSDARRFVPDPEVVRRCREHVRRHGGASFFQRPAWSAELQALAPAGAGAFESDVARATAIRDELAGGRDLINAHLRTNTVHHAALPWGIAGTLTRQALADTGHVSAFAERPMRRRAVYYGDNRYQLMRLNGKFLTCLPGKGRRWFFTAMNAR